MEELIGDGTMMKKRLCRIMMTIWMMMGRVGGKVRMGVSTSAYQVEGAWSDRSMTIWDVFAHEDDGARIVDGSNGDVACDSYHRWAEDVGWAEWLGASVYRFSLSWPWVLTDEGLAHYDGLIDALVVRNITPLVTLTHWDIPQSMQMAYGGWENDAILEDLEVMARRVFAAYGDRVHNWITLNEPLTVTMMGYGNGAHAPGKAEPSRLVYEVAHRMIRAHVRIYRLYHTEFAKSQGGRVGIALNSDFVQARDPKNEEDMAAAQRGLLWRMGWFADPLLLTGDYPHEMRSRCGDRLPEFNEEMTKRGVAPKWMDFFALNHYTTLEATPQWNGEPNVFTDPQVAYRFPSSSTSSASAWLHSYPPGMAGMIQWLDSRYHLSTRNLSLIVTESGFSTADGETVIVEDARRVAYLEGYRREAVAITKELGIRLEAFCVWSLMDNFEWAAGFTERYGLLHVDRETLVRTPRHSAYWFRNVSRSGM